MTMAGAEEKELTVCDVMGDWGAYQWSVTLFAVVYSALLAVTLVVGPIWTPEMSHLCANQSTQAETGTETQTFNNFSSKPRQCTTIERATTASGNLIQQEIKCQRFVYDEAEVGKVLTNEYDLVCDREWLKSFLSSSALAGMLLSSVSLGLVSDKYGRLRCIEVGVAMSILATTGAILSHNYFLLNLCFLIMSFAQVGAANALCTLVMEATSPRFRFVPVFQYGIGWGIGVILTPFIQNWTLNYMYYLFVLLLWQLLMLPWLHFGVFESIRWLLSEGKINRAQIELQRACRMNGVKSSAKTATEIAQIQVQQVRKASRVIESDEAPRRLAQMLERQVDSTAQELGMLSAAIKRSFGFSGEMPELDDDEMAYITGEAPEPPTVERVGGGPAKLSPTLGRCSFSLQPESVLAPADIGPSDAKMSLTTQGLIVLAMRYRKALQQEEEGRFFLVQMFHAKLWKRTLLLMMLSVMLETSYYGFIQAQKFVGDSVTLNYVIGGVSEFVASSLYMLVLWAFPRRVAIILPVALGIFALLGMAATYHWIPDEPRPDTPTGQPLDARNVHLAEFQDQLDSIVIASDNITAIIDATLTSANSSSAGNEPSIMLLNSSIQLTVALRHQINMWLMNIGKLADSVAIQVGFTIAMEAYPNNLRQTGPGVIVFIGRIGSIVAPFLFNDLSPDKLMFKITLVTLAAIGTLACILTPLFIGKNKNKELSDHMQDIRED